MEILKRFKSWLSFKKEGSSETDAKYQQNEERSTNKKKRSIKRNAEPISDEESVKRKHHKRETVTESSNKTQLEEDTDLKNMSLPKQNHKDQSNAQNSTRNIAESKETHIADENENNTLLSGYEIKAIENIHDIREKCKRFDQEIEDFKDIMGSKQFLFVDENLQRHIEKLDQIDAKESTKIRKERKSAIKYICLLIDRLEFIAKKNQEQLQPKQQPTIAPISRQQFLEGKKEE